MPKVNILILNYNGKDLMEKFLGSIVKAASLSRYPCRVTVIDNASSDDSVLYVQNNFPSVEIIREDENKILCSYNDALNIVDDDIAILLNNDIKVDEYFIDPLVEAFVEDSTVFMATSKVFKADGCLDGTNTVARIKWGLFWASAKYLGFEKNQDNKLPTFSAGIGAFDRKKFTELGGYDDLYLPGTLEDSDICFRAWKKGWKCIYQPRSIIYHMGQVSFHRRFGKKGTSIINARNLFLFMWKNITDKKIIFSHLFFLPLRLAYALISGKNELVIGFFQAFGKIGEALRKRKEALALPVKRSDKQVFGFFKT